MGDETKYMVKWGHKGFLVTPKKVVPFEGLSTSHGLESEYHEDTSGAETVYVRSRQMQTITFRTSYLSALGVDPKNQMKQWYDLIGKTYPMYIGGKQFGPPLLQLEKVDWDNFLFAPNGHIIGVDATITLQEYIGEKKEITQKTFDSWTKKTDAKAEALDAGPSKKEKEELKTK